jgi:hypothetical protein
MAKSSHKGELCVCGEFIITGLVATSCRLLFSCLDTSERQYYWSKTKISFFHSRFPSFSLSRFGFIQESPAAVFQPKDIKINLSCSHASHCLHPTITPPPPPPSVPL